MAPGDVTSLLVDWANGDEQALERLTLLVYKELRQLAAGHLRRERPDHTLQPTALVHEAYLRLVDQRNPDWQNRAHFFGVAAHLMREVLVDHARRHNAGKRAAPMVSLEESVELGWELSSDVVEMDSALKKLEKVDRRKCQAVELRYFGGLSMDETARALEVSVPTVRRDLRMDEAWLHREMRGG
jgi:RNA polymerase sigma-70 factor (ECF subfamily)